MACFRVSRTISAAPPLAVKPRRRHSSCLQTVHFAAPTMLHAPSLRGEAIRWPAAAAGCLTHRPDGRREDP